jgi:hypothetical protein
LTRPSYGAKIDPAATIANDRYLSQKLRHRFTAFRKLALGNAITVSDAIGEARANRLAQSRS